MKRAKSAETLAGRRWRPSHAIVAAAALYLVVISLKYRHFFEIAAGDSGDAYEHGGFHRKLEVSPKEESPPRTPEADPLIARARPWTTTGAVNSPSGYGRITGEILKRYRESRGRNWTRSGNFSELEKMATEAWALGRKAWEEAKSYNDAGGDLNPVVEGKSDACPSSVSIPSGGESEHDGEKLLFLPCGLAVGSSITVIGTPHSAHKEYVPELAKLEGDGTVMVAQFMVELRGLKAVDGEDPPKILHLNPRLKGDWSKKPVIELNTCYRMQWGKAMRCDGLPSLGFDDIVDGFLRCEKWERSDIVDSKESKTTSWLQRFIGRAKKPEMTWPFPFVEGRLFVLTVQAGVEGYHIIVGGRHVSSFPYRTGFTLEDATGLAVKGNVDIHSIYATSLPRTHPSFSLQQVLEMSENWKARPLLPEEPVQLFIGILSATNHFAERMAIRKTWMQCPALQLGNVVARFFVALGPRKEVNAAVKKEAEYFGDMMIMPFLDRYELVVLKTIAICEFGVHNLTADYIMKCDDDTFVRVDVVLKEINAISRTRSLYMGNLNLLHRPLRSGKWAVTQEEWPEDVYPPYANGPGYVISSDIARYIVSQRANQSLRMFKMEDVSMGMWVEDFNSSANVQYSHSWKFCQYGCLENYYTAHYQSPRQMICLWDKLSRGRAQCCNFR